MLIAAGADPNARTEGRARRHRCTGRPAAIRSQQDHVLQQWPTGSPWLFRGITGNGDGSKAYSHSTFTGQLAHWQRVIDLRDQSASRSP
jgi:hypothetical protein